MPIPAAGDSPLPPAIGRYRPVKVLGRGGMAEVVLAEISGPAGFSRQVALKYVLPEHASNPAVVKMFLDEARLGAQFSHPNIIQVHDFGEADGRYFLAMEYARGQSVRAVCKQLFPRGLRFPDQVVAAVGAQAASALAYAHAAVDAEGRPMQVVHRDVTPENLMLTVEGGLKLFDFGIARATSRQQDATAMGVVKGKPAYMAPEQIGEVDVDGRVDVYALCASLWEMLAGERLFRGKDDTEVLKKVLIEAPRDLAVQVPDCHPSLAAIIMSGLAKEREQRPRAVDLQRSLETWLHSISVTNPQTVIAAFLRGELVKARAQPGEGAVAAQATPASLTSKPDWMMDESNLAEASQALAVDAPRLATGAADAFSLPPPTVSARANAPGPTPEAPLELARPARPAPRASNPGLAAPAPRPGGNTFAPPRPVASAARPDAKPPPWLDRRVQVGAAVAVLAVVGLAIALKPTPAPVAPVVAVDPDTVAVRVESTPPAAAIDVDGRPTGLVTPAEVRLRAPANHALALRLAGFEVWSDAKVLALNPGKVVTASLRPLARITVDSTPTEALVRLDGGVVVPSTPGAFEANAGRVAFRVEKEGFMPGLVEQAVQEGGNQISVTLLPASYLALTSEPSGAEIFLDGVDTGVRTPTSHLAVTAGKDHVVLLKQLELSAGPRHVKKAAAGVETALALKLHDVGAAQRKMEAQKARARIAQLTAEKDRLEAELDKLFLKKPQRYTAHKLRIEAIEEEIDRLEMDLEPE